MKANPDKCRLLLSTKSPEDDGSIYFIYFFIKKFQLLMEYK